MKSINSPKSSILLLLLALLPAIAVRSNAAEYLCRFVGINDGLSQSYITDITRDWRGFLWVATPFGLNRYDFNDVRSYYHSSDNDRSLPDNDVRTLFTDSRGKIWLACDMGTARYNESTDDFTHIKLSGTRVNVRSFYDDGKGVLMGSAGRLYYYAHGCDSLTEIKVNGGSKKYYTRILPMNKDRLLLVTRWDGVWIYNRKKSSVTRMPGINHRHITAATVDSKGYLWVAPYGKGILCYSTDGRCVDSINTSNSQLPNNLVLDLMLQKDKLWIGTDGGGISIWNNETRNFEVTALTAPKSVTNLYRDRHNNIYGGTVRDGIMTVRRVGMRTFQNNPAEGTTISAIISMCSDPDGTIWLGDDGNGVLRLSRNDRLENIQSTRGMKVLDVVKYDDNTLLLSTFDRGFRLLDKHTLQLRRAPEALDRLYSELAARALGIHTLDLGGGNLALISDRISIYNIATNTISEPMGRQEAPLLPVYHANSILICYCNDFVCEYDLSVNTCRKLIKAENDEKIVCARYDGSRNIYYTTGTDLRKYDVISGTTTQLDVENLSRISSLAIDGDNLWIGSNRSIYLRDLKENKMLEFGEFDGVLPNEYLPESVLLSPDAVYMGGVNGLLRIDRGDIDRMISHETPITLNVADLIVDGVSLYSQVHDGQIDIAPNHTTVNMLLVADGGNYLRRQPIRYHIRGGDIDRVFESSDHSIDLSMLKEGHSYDIMVYSTMPDGSWSNGRHLMTMNMLSPWYTSNWLIGTMCLLLLLSMVWMEISRRRRHRYRLERRLEDYRNSSLEKEIAFLVNTNYALRTPLTLIYAPVKHLIEQARMSDQNKDLSQLNIIYSNAKKMRDAIDMALALHHVGFEKADINLTRHNLHSVLDKAVDSRRAEADLKRIGIIVDAPAEAIYVKCNADRMHIILGTFIDNALHRSTEKGIVRIVVRYSDENRKMLRVIISDNGQSLAEDQLTRLFSKYSTDSSATFGNALAFAYAKTMAQAQNGDVGASNNRDLPGMNVWVDIPADSSEKPQTQPRTNENILPEASTAESLIVDTDTSGMTALVVEDDKDLCLFITASLAPHFGQILHAFNGKDAWLLVQQHQPDIVISSLMLSTKSGLELCHDLKTHSETSHIPVIILSAFKDDPELERGYSVGADSYLAKPFDINVLLTRCRSLLHNRSVLRKRYEQSWPRTASMGLPNASESFLMKIDRIIEENIANSEFGVDTLLDKLMMSRSALYSKFKEITGNTIGNYITDFRIRKAKELLDEGNMSMSEISERLGFSSQRYFSTFFKEHSGQSPSAYRRHKNTPPNNTLNHNYLPPPHLTNSQTI